MSEQIEQRSPEWFAQRLGKVTASRVADVIAKTKSGPSASRKNYMSELLCERLTGQATEGYTSPAMQWGTEVEPQARAAYSFDMGEIVEVGFVNHPSIEMSGASPDGLVGADGLVEIKCPNTATHIEYLLANEVPAKYKPQMSWQLACTGRKWCDFVSYDPRLPVHLQIFVKRYTPSAEYVSELESEIVAFLKELDSLVDRLSKVAA